MGSGGEQRWIGGFFVWELGEVAMVPGGFYAFQREISKNQNSPSLCCSVRRI